MADGMSAARHRHPVAGTRLARQTRQLSYLSSAREDWDGKVSLERQETALFMPSGEDDHRG